MKFLNHISALFLVLSLNLGACADETSKWVNRWNAEPGRQTKLKADQVILKAADSEALSGLWAAGFRQTDGEYVLGRLVWKDKSWSPLRGFAQVLSDSDFPNLDDGAREALFLSLLKNTYGKLGTLPYTGKASRHRNRPKPIVGVRGLDGSHRFQVWFYDSPVKKEGGEWREVLYFVSADAKTLKARTLGSYHPIAERLRDFPTISTELFE